MPLRLTDAALKKRILAFIADWRDIVGLTHWDVRVKWNELEYQATVVVELPQYEWVTIHCNLKKIREKQDSLAELEELVVHELSHTFTWVLARGIEGVRLQDEAQEHFEEVATTQISRALIRARNQGRG